MPFPAALVYETPASYEVILAVADPGGDYKLALQLTDDNGVGYDLTGCTVDAWAHSLDGTRRLQLGTAWLNISAGEFAVEFDRDLVDDLAPDEPGPRARRIDLGGYSVALSAPGGTPRVVVLHGPLVGVRR